MATGQLPEFIVTKPVDFESTQNRPHASSTASVQKEKRWEPIARNLLTKKLPQTEQDWDRVLLTQDDVNRVLQRIVLSHLTPTAKAALSWRGRFGACSKHFELLAGDKTNKNPIDLFRLAVIALSEVAIKEGLPSDETYEYLRLCLRRYPRSAKQLGDESLRKTVKAVREGIQFVEGFTDILGPRSNELPLYVKSWTTVFHDYTAECGEYIAQQKHRVYRPEKKLQSGCLSVINVVYLLLGGECSGRSPRTIRDIFLPNDTLDCQSWSGSDLPPRSLLQSCNPFSPAPGRGESVKLFSFGDRAVELKQAAISDILTDVIISRPIQKARGLYSFGLPLASKKYFTAIIEKSVKLKHWAFKQGITLETLLNLPAEAFRTEVGTATWPTSGGALLLPLTNGAVDVKLLHRDTGTARRKVWHPNHIMYLAHEGLAAINGSIHYIYAPLPRPL